MKYKEFREYLKINEIHTQEDKERIIAAYQYEISKIEERSIIFLISLVDFPRDFQLLKKAIELAETPLEEREGEKKYYLKHRFINKYTAVEHIKRVITGEAILSDRHGDLVLQTKFTKAEIEELKKRFNIDLKDFDFIEAED